MTKLENKKVVMIVAKEGFRDEELFEPKEVLEQAGIKVSIASSAHNAKGKLGGQTKADLMVDSLNIDDFDAVIFVGGPGSKEYFKNPTAHKIANETIAKGKILASICSAGQTLAYAGVLKGKKATVFPGDAEVLKNLGVNYTGKPVEQDGNIITADGPGSAKAFGEALVRALSK